MKLIKGWGWCYRSRQSERNIFDFLDLKEKGGYKLPVVGVSFCKLSKNIHELEDFQII